MKRVAQLWNWLPTFRAAGETELLSQAGEDLGVSTSAVSRAVRLLEQDLGVPLFERFGRSVRLNEAGQEFLNATRNAMRVMDEAIAQAKGNRTRGTVRIAAGEPHVSLFLIPALPLVQRTHPGVLPHVAPPRREGPVLAASQGRSGRRDHRARVDGPGTHVPLPRCGQFRVLCWPRPSAPSRSDRHASRVREFPARGVVRGSDAKRGGRPPGRIGRRGAACVVGGRRKRPVPGVAARRGWLASAHAETGPPRSPSPDERLRGPA